MNTPELETERLRLRKFTENDLSAIYAIFSDQEVNTYLPWYPLASLADTQSFFEKHFLSVYAKPKGYAYAITQGILAARNCDRSGPGGDSTG